MLASEKPIWSGELHNCGLILGTNALVDLGFQVMYSNGTVVHPEGYQGSVNPKQNPSTASSMEAEEDGITHSINMQGEGRNQYIRSNKSSCVNGIISSNC